MKIFVAGGTGAIGRPLIAKLLAKGHTLVALTRASEKTQALVEQGIEPAIADVFVDKGSVAHQCGRSQTQKLIDHRVCGRCPEAARHLRKRGEIGEDHRHLHEAALLQVCAALGAAIEVTRASTNASPPQENGGQAHERNAADEAVGGERRSFGL